MSPRLHDIKDIVRALAERAPSLAAELLPGGRREGGEWRCGSLAGEAGQSLGIVLRGPKAGLWQDFATGETGDALDLVAQVLYGGDKGQAVAWARSWLGWGTGEAPAPAARPPSVADQARAVEREQASRKRIAGIAKAIWLEAVPLSQGDPVTAYLAGRAIDLGRLPKVPGALRYHPRLHCAEVDRELPAMVAAISAPPWPTDRDPGPGEAKGMVAIHRTWLAKAADGRWRKADLAKPKKVLGPSDGGLIPLARGASGRSLRSAPPGDRLAIAEGIETALSCAVIDPAWRTVAGINLGNIGKLRLAPIFSRIVLMIDRDRYHPGTYEGKLRALDELARQGHPIEWLAPPQPHADWNDWLQAEAARGALPGLVAGEP